MKITPGKWRLNHKGEPVVVWGIREGEYAVWVPDETYDNQTDDARLIAAAPELLEACKAVLAYDNAIYRRGVNGEYEVDAEAALAAGADLDALYEDMRSKAIQAIASCEGVRNEL